MNPDDITLELARLQREAFTRIRAKIAAQQLGEAWKGLSTMQIQSATRDELALILHGLRAIHVLDMERTRAKLEEQVRNELLTRYGVSDVSSETRTIFVVDTKN